MKCHQKLLFDLIKINHTDFCVHFAMLQRDGTHYARFEFQLQWQSLYFTAF